MHEYHMGRSKWGAGTRPHGLSLEGLINPLIKGNFSNLSF